VACILLSCVIINFYPAFVVFVDTLKYYKIKCSCFYTSFVFKINENFDFFVELFEAISFHFFCAFFIFLFLYSHLRGFCNWHLDC